MKHLHSFLIAIAMIHLSASAVADQTTDETGKCPCIAEKTTSPTTNGSSKNADTPSYGCPASGCPASNTDNEETPSCGCPAKTDTPKESNSCGCPAKTENNEKSPACGCPAKAETDEDDNDADDEETSNDKDDCEKDKYTTVECDDVYCRCFPLSLSHTEGHWFDNKTGYTSMRWFWPFPATINCNCFPFADIRGHVFNNGTTAGNLGGGIRLISDLNGTTIFGVNGFYDYRKAAWNNYFQQFGFGFEVLNPCFDFRLNGYIPFGKQKAHSKIHHCFSRKHGTSGTFQKRERVLAGFDASLGKWIVKDACGRFDYYATLGIYSYFPAKQHKHKHIFGGEVRLMANLLQYFSLELRGGYDNYFGTQAQGTLAVYIPLGVCPCHCYTNSYIYDNCYLRERICQPLLRQEIMCFDKKECKVLFGNKNCCKKRRCGGNNHCNCQK